VVSIAILKLLLLLLILLLWVGTALYCADIGDVRRRLLRHFRDVFDYLGGVGAPCGET
jgi:hypothetical protein